MFRISFEPYLTPERFQAIRAQMFCSFRLLEFSIYTARGVECECILFDANEAHKAAQALSPPTVFS